MLRYDALTFNSVDITIQEYTEQNGQVVSKFLERHAYTKLNFTVQNPSDNYEDRSIH